MPDRVAMTISNQQATDMPADMETRESASMKRRARRGGDAANPIVRTAIADPITSMPDAHPGSISSKHRYGRAIRFDNSLAGGNALTSNEIDVERWLQAGSSQARSGEESDNRDPCPWTVLDVTNEDLGLEITPSNSNTCSIVATTCHPS